MKKGNFFSRDTNNSTVDDNVMAVMLKNACNGEFFCDEAVNLIECEEASVEHLPAILFGLTRATASFLKSLEKTEIHAKSLFEGMLNVWLNDVDDYDYFEKWVRELNEHQYGLK